MPQEVKSMPPPLPGADGQIASPAGFRADLHDAQAATDILEKAFDFRGDVTLTLRDGRAVSGYLFDRVRAPNAADSYVRVMPPPMAGAAQGGKVRVTYAEIASIAFSDRDPAAGKSFETWVKKYVEKKLKGETASIEAEALD